MTAYSRCLTAVFLALAGTFAIPISALAAQSYDNCSGFIDTLPATISTQGVWCLRHDLATAITSGPAITIATNNVTIDCNDFKIGGLAAGLDSTATGIYTGTRQNATIRHCSIRGFYHGIYLLSGAGHLVEDNRLDNNLRYGIRVFGEHNRIRRNAVFDTGGHPGDNSATGIYAQADIVDNLVEGVFTDATTLAVYGIVTPNNGARIRGNRVSGIALNGGGQARGIYAVGSDATIADNNIVASVASTSGYAIDGNDSFCSGNTSANFATPMIGCDDLGGNAGH